MFLRYQWSSQVSLAYTCKMRILIKVLPHPNAYTKSANAGAGKAGQRVYSQNMMMLYEYQWNSCFKGRAIHFPTKPSHDREHSFSVVSFGRGNTSNVLWINVLHQEFQCVLLHWVLSVTNCPSFLIILSVGHFLLFILV